MKEDQLQDLYDPQENQAAQLASLIGCQFLIDAENTLHLLCVVHTAT